MFFLAVPAFTFLGISGPIVSGVWIGRYEPAFVHFVALLCVGWLVNSLANPAYVVDIGTGALRWVSVGCLTTAVLNVLLAFAAGKLIGGTAVVAASVLSLIVGYVIVVAAYHSEHRVPFGELLPGESIRLFTATAGGALALCLFFVVSNRFGFPSQTAVAFTGALAAIVFTTMWAHPLRKRLLSWVFS